MVCPIEVKKTLDYLFQKIGGTIFTKVHISVIIYSMYF